MDRPSPADVASSLARAHPPDHGLSLRFTDFLVRIRSNSEALARRLRAYYAGFVTSRPGAHAEVLAFEAEPPALDLPLRLRQRPPGKKPKEAFADLPGGRAVRKVRTGMHFFFGPGVHCAVGPCADNLNQVVNFVNNRFVQKLLDEGCLLCHAAAVRYGGRGMAVAGVSGAGKSTLALHLMGPGVDYVSNDRVLLRREQGTLQARGLPKQPRVNPGTLLHHPRLARLLSDGERRRLAALDPEELWELEDKRDAPIHRLYGEGRFVLSAGLSWLVLLGWERRGPAPRVQEVPIADRPDLLAALRKEPGVFYLPPEGGSGAAPPLEAYAAALADCRCVEITGGADFPSAARACLRLLRS